MCSLIFICLMSVLSNKEIYPYDLWIRIWKLLVLLGYIRVFVFPYDEYVGENMQFINMQGSTLTFWPTCPFGQVPIYFTCPKL